MITKFLFKVMKVEMATESCECSSVQSHSHVQLFAAPWTTACKPSLSITNSQSILRLISTVLVMPSNHLICCCPLLLLPSVFSSIRNFSNESVLRIRWPKYLEFQLQHQSFQWSPLGWTGWISFQSKGLSRDFSNTTVQKHQFFGTHSPYVTTGKTIALTRRTFVGKVMSLLFNMLSRLVITFLIPQYKTNVQKKKIK